MRVDWVGRHEKEEKAPSDVDGEESCTQLRYSIATGGASLLRKGGQEPDVDDERRLASERPYRDSSWEFTTNLYMVYNSPCRRVMEEHKSESHGNSGETRKPRGRCSEGERHMGYRALQNCS